MLITLNDLKTLLGITDGSEDAYLNLMGAMASEVVEKYCNRTFAKATYTNELYEGTGTNELVLKHHPLVSVASVYENYGMQGSPQWQLIDSDYYSLKLESGKIYFSGRIWGKGAAYKVTYEAGYTDIPYPIQMAVYEIVKEKRATKTAASGLKKETLGEYSYEKFDTTVTGSDVISKLGLATLLDPYREFAL